MLHIMYELVIKADVLFSAIRQKGKMYLTQRAKTKFME